MTTSRAGARVRGYGWYRPRYEARYAGRRILSNAFGGGGFWGEDMKGMRERSGERAIRPFEKANCGQRAQERKKNAWVGLGAKKTRLCHTARGPGGNHIPVF
jgi:hypothetical protein